MNFRVDAEVSKGKSHIEPNREGEEGTKQTTKVCGTKNRLSRPQFDWLSLSLSPMVDHSNTEQETSSNQSDMDCLINPIGRDMTINCLLHLSRAEYGSIASLNRSFHSLIRSGDIYRLRKQHGVIEHWVYLSCRLMEWVAFDPSSRRWMQLPRMNCTECFMCSDKESLAVGTDLLVLGKDVFYHMIYKYSILTNSWSSGMSMNHPRCLFGSASDGKIAIFAGGCDTHGTILSFAELYDSETQTWETLPNINKRRKMCSGFFMDGKFYVIGGIGGDDGKKILRCAEEFDLTTRTWTEIPNMAPPKYGIGPDGNTPRSNEAPPLVAVVNNELYAADHADRVLRKYKKDTKEWKLVGSLPERVGSTHGWGLAFRACGERLIIIGGSKAHGDRIIQVNAWVPNEGPLHWELLGIIQLGSFVYNCTVMAC